MALVKAYVIINDKGEQVGLMNCKYPKDGMGKLYVYLHLFGSTMKVATASGCGYDKLGAALYKLAKTYAADQEHVFKQDEIDFLIALESCDSGFDSWATYGAYKFLRAI
ncbi:MAG: hypothetical protein RR959_06125 [Erysipelotrichaceae bacterium]